MRASRDIFLTEFFDLACAFLGSTRSTGSAASATLSEVASNPPMGAGLAAPDPTAFGWLLLVAGALISAGLLPMLASALRRRLPERRLDNEVFPFALRPRRSLPSPVLGLSLQTRRALRQAVGAHRTFLAAGVLSAIGLVLLTLMPALRRIGESGLLVALAFALPTLIVAWHGRRRDARASAETAAVPTSTARPLEEAVEVSGAAQAGGEAS